MYKNLCPEGEIVLNPEVEANTTSPEGEANTTSTEGEENTTNPQVEATTTSPKGEANTTSTDGARSTSTRRPNPRYFGSQWTTMARRQTQQVKVGTLNNACVQSLDWSSGEKSLSSDYTTFKTTTDASVNYITNEIDWWNPLTLAANVNVSDNPRWHEAMNSPD